MRLPLRNRRRLPLAVQNQAAGYRRVGLDSTTGLAFRASANDAWILPLVALSSGGRILFAADVALARDYKNALARGHENALRVTTKTDVMAARLTAIGAEKIPGRA